MQPTRWDEVPVEKISETVTRQVIWGKNGNIARLCFAKGTHTSPHQHEAEQHTCLMQGALKLRVGDENITLRPGDILVVPSGVEHEAWALEDTVLIDFFSPLRRDWLEGESGYDSARNLPTNGDGEAEP
jgi:quercetin dioxygenase-like cupin family protein